MLMRITMIVTTTISSTKVNPRMWRRPPGLRTRQAGRPAPPLPLGIRSAIGSLICRLAIHVENTLSAPGETLGVILIAAQAPFGPAGERVDGNAAQETHLLSIGTGQLDAFHQLVQRLGPVV